MNCRPLQLASLRSRARAFSLIEILVVVALLSVIILGLVLMFDQTQRAFRAGMTQTDVLEGGRAATELIARELSQMTPANDVNARSFQAWTPYYSYLEQGLPGNSPLVARTNVLERLYFLTRENQTLKAIGYAFDDSEYAGGVGTLYRFEGEMQTITNSNPEILFMRFTNTFSNVKANSRVIDGVVTFKVRTYSTNGTWISSNLGNNIYATTTNSPSPGEVWFYQFNGSAVPAYVEVELGVLEQRVLKKADSLPTTGTNPRREYLKKQAAHVHVFRLRVPIRNVNTAAYQ
ncbi:MAG: prepilin-type N-terminal cleavage/methylation domain-containing protein [Verrucomicrobia bacterium]|nr:MAG: prepilin-type N-terminal cleavage/methylation domain-containing protein [Verrucomicrobiota bacterium]